MKITGKPWIDQNTHTCIKHISWLFLGCLFGNYGLSIGDLFHLGFCIQKLLLH